MKTQVLVIGAGASGLTAAIYAARGRCEVHIIEAQDRPAKKILATGNGKCNYTNEKMELSCYRSASLQQAEAVLLKYPTSAAIDYLKELGIRPSTRDGYLYPSSGQAASVAECLLMEAKRLHVVIHTDSPVKQIKKTRDGFEAVTAAGEHFTSDALILAAGSLAGMKAGKLADPQGFCRTLGLKVQPVVPALTALVQEKDPVGKLWSGVRVQATVKVFSDGKCMNTDTGEVQLTDYGISGIPVFQVSRYAAYSLLKKKKTEAVLDFMPSMTKEELLEELCVRTRFTERSAQGQLCGLWNSKLVQALCKKARIAIDCPMRLTDCEHLAALAKEYRIRITGTNPIGQSQVCAGGADLREINQETMECINVPGLYLTGELLDVDGICGGYNLHWAWATGTIAGKAVASAIKTHAQDNRKHTKDRKEHIKDNEAHRNDHKAHTKENNEYTKVYNAQKSRGKSR